MLGLPVDRLCILTLLIGSAASFAALYQRAVEQSSSEHTLIRNIPSGRNSFVLRAADGCPGSITVSAVDTGSIGIQIEGVVRTAVIRPSQGQQRLDATLSGMFFFNPLGQLTQGQLSILAGGRTVSATIQNPNPITITATLPDVEKPISATIPGPMLITKQANDSYALQYHALALPGMADRKVQLPFEIIPEADASPRCRGPQGDPESRLDLTPWLALAERSNSWLSAFSPRSPHRSTSP